MSETLKKIIHVDDVNCSLISVKSRLNKIFDVIPANSSIKLYALLEKFIPDLILLDADMPEIDGYETIKGLKANDRYVHIPVVFLTGRSDRASVVKGISLGAADYIFKPVQTEKLIETLDNILNPKEQIQPEKKEDNVNKPGVLAVDDVASMLRAIQYALQDRYNVYLLSKPEGVPNFLKTEKPDLILLDYLMPTMSGFDLISIIKTIPEHKDTPIIIITTEGTSDHVMEAINLGASDFIVKPFNPKELNNKVAKHIRISNELRIIREENSKLLG